MIAVMNVHRLFSIRVNFGQRAGVKDVCEQMILPGYFRRLRGARRPRRARRRGGSRRGRRARARARARAGGRRGGRSAARRRAAPRWRGRAATPGRAPPQRGTPDRTRCPLCHSNRQSITPGSAFEGGQHARSINLHDVCSQPPGCMLSVFCSSEGSPHGGIANRRGARAEHP